jgi:IclR family transcriptional regulator, acetate operon repressor
VAGNSTEPGQSVTSRVSAILLAFTDCDERSLTDIARLAGLPVSTAHRLAIELASGTRMVTTTLGRRSAESERPNGGRRPWLNVHRASLRT